MFKKSFLVLILLSISYQNNINASKGGYAALGALAGLGVGTAIGATANRPSREVVYVQNDSNSRISRKERELRQWERELQDWSDELNEQSRDLAKRERLLNKREQLLEKKEQHRSHCSKIHSTKELIG